jgi:hypothetical protein
MAEIDDWTLPPPKAAADWTMDPIPPPVAPWKPEPSWATPAAPAAPGASGSSPSWMPDPSPEPTADMWLTAAPSVIDWAQPEPEPEPPPSMEPGLRPNLRPALKAVSDVLNEVLGSGNANLSSFKMTQRLLSKHNRIPAAMLQSTHPYLQEVQDRLVPVLKQITPFRGITDEAVTKLEGYCRDLRRPDLSPTQLKDDVPKKMERLLRFLEALRAAVPPL